MAKIISVINQPTADSLMCLLDLAQVLKYGGQAVGIVGDVAYQTLLFNYRLNLLEISGVNLYGTLDELQDEQVILYNGYCESAEHYIVLVEHNLFAIKSLSDYMQALELAEATFVLLNALDVKQDIDYVYRVYFERFVNCPNKLALPFDEVEYERHYRAQLAQEVDLKGISRQRLTLYWQIVKDFVAEDIKTVRQLHQLIKRG